MNIDPTDIPARMADQAAGLRAMHASGGGAAFGGTPSDASLIRAISEIKARGLKVTLVPSFRAMATV